MTPNPSIAPTKCCLAALTSSQDCPAEYLAGVASMFSMTPERDGNGTPDQSIQQKGAEGRAIP